MFGRILMEMPAITYLSFFAYKDAQYGNLQYGSTTTDFIDNGHVRCISCGTVSSRKMIINWR